jgi:hypothetical protein
MIPPIHRRRRRGGWSARIPPVAVQNDARLAASLVTVARISTLSRLGRSSMESTPQLVQFGLDTST